MKKAIIALVFIVSILSVKAQDKTYQPNWKSLDERPTPEWFTKAKFGIFIHWGVYSVPAWAPTDIAVGKNFGQKFSEWYWYRLKDSTNKFFAPHHKKLYGDKSYQDFASDFTAEHFNPSKWADIIADSGAKYVVLTSKHHDGYTLWPSEQSWNWNSVDVGSRKDLCGELTNAVKEKGLHMGFYYSLYEWFNPLYNKDVNAYVDKHMIPQMKDLVTRYEPDVLWTDGEWPYTSDVWKSEEFLAWLFNESKVKETVAVNDRWGKHTRSTHGGYYTTEYDHVYQKEGVDDVYHPWEECRGIGGSFGYNRMENLNHYSSSERLVHMLIEKVASGGNLLLNIGPSHDGRIPVIMQQRLADIGQWLKINGEAIYGTNVWGDAPKMNEEGIYFTKKGKNLYVICTTWNKRIELPISASKAQLVGSNADVKYEKTKTGMTLYAPDLQPNNILGQYAWVYKIEGVF
ncbi:alpha-L-fucosidase [Flagellimonas sp. CMM7]|uniref:alpha-L-fucosidase n=1 Tax=Flagellimonas sp. CMM7 TaxID=2654676 RepID=UPI0013D31918|nr:alpha-L-fucosidase [Flagellimonas sp. CMM7]UII78737.1 alpha-L-fucosidase [Flagellimonas sp. CMM7]